LYLFVLTSAGYLHAFPPNTDLNNIGPDFTPLTSIYLKSATVGKRDNGFEIVEGKNTRWGGTGSRLYLCAPTTIETGVSSLQVDIDGWWNDIVRLSGVIPEQEEGRMEGATTAGKETGRETGRETGKGIGEGTAVAAAETGAGATMPTTTAQPSQPSQPSAPVTTAFSTGSAAPIVGAAIPTPRSSEPTTTTSRATEPTPTGTAAPTSGSGTDSTGIENKMEQRSPFCQVEDVARGQYAQYGASHDMSSGRGQGQTGHGQPGQGQIGSYDQSTEIGQAAGMGHTIPSTTTTTTPSNKLQGEQTQLPSDTATIVL